ncbi:MAG: hypothetical protein LBR50_06585 [Tannerella sp.]|jgi:hypothetical protein|nr:hypothetical protein [Tannerella sp.]
MEKKLDEKHALKFLIYAVLLGDILPLGIMYIFDKLEMIDIVPSDSAVLTWSMIAFLLSSIVGTFFAILLQNKKWLYGSGLISLICVSVIVFYTGGLFNSAMSFYFIFIPSAVAVCFDLGKDERGLGIIFTYIECVIFILALFVIDLFCPTTYNRHKILDLIFILIQISLICLMELDRYESKLSLVRVILSKINKNEMDKK